MDPPLNLEIGSLSIGTSSFIHNELVWYISTIPAYYGVIDRDFNNVEGSLLTNSFMRLFLQELLNIKNLLHEIPFY